MATSQLARPRVRPAALAGLRWVLMLFCLAVVGLLALQVVTHGPMLELDQEVSRYFATHRIAVLTALALALSTAHQTLYVLAATALVAFWRAWRHDWNSARSLLVVPVGMLLNFGLKNVVQRARPHWDDPLVHLASYSFPSGHAAASTLFYGMLCALVFAHTRSTRWRALAAAGALFMILLVCCSRIYLGAHYPGDVLGGFALGTACVLLFLRPQRR